ncbi:MAG: solute:Na+ symporter, family [Solirubrobacteraceae bacterium]|jgi:SSS family solute:Na+ symporter|nr:solute:Na+ symporter, family [Solirubrobacteraceae bacterium]
MDVPLAASALRLNATALDYSILAIYFLVVLGIGAVARLSIKTDIDFFLSGRRLPAWITGLAFIAANLGALEILGMAANGAQYGVATVHFYWLGAVPAMVFLGLVMMPFYYGAKVRSVPEYLRLRFNNATHVLNAATFAIATVLIAGVNLFALALIVNLMLGWSIGVAILVAAVIVLAYITLGGLTSAIYNEVLQFFIIIAALLPLTLVALHDMGGWGGLSDKVRQSKLGEGGLHAWKGLAVGHVTNPIDANWIAIVLGLGFVLSFGYWTTNFAEVQRALSAKSLSASRRTPLIGAYPKIFIPALTIIPGLVALVSVKGLGGSSPDLQYNNAIPLLIGRYLPEGMLGLAVTGLLAAFMAGVAANITAFNTVVTYDLWQDYVRRDRDEQYYVRAGRIATVGGLLVSVATAFIAKGYSNIMNYVQLLFSYFNAPLFATFIIAMFWRRSTPWAGFFGLIAGFLGAFLTHLLYSKGVIDLGSQLAASFWGAMIAFAADAVVTVAVSLVTRPKPEEELRGLVWGLTRKEEDPVEHDPGDDVWYRSPWLLGAGAIVLVVILNIVFI